MPASGYKPGPSGMTPRPARTAPTRQPATVPPPPPPAPLPDTRAPTLTARALGGQRGERPLFRGLELTLAPGRLVWLRGRNGRGKTSLLRILAGLSSPAAGEVLCDGRPLRQLGPEWRQRLLYIAHANALKDDLTVAESLRFLGALHGRAPTAAEIESVLSLLGIARCKNAAVRTLSQGQRRRAALARLALPQAPSIWLLDEPFDSLDDEGIQALHGVLAAQARRGGSVLMTSHQAITLADPVPEVLDLDRFAVAT
jgi:heme exporter protein A